MPQKRQRLHAALHQAPTSAGRHKEKRSSTHSSAAPAKKTGGLEPHTGVAAISQATKTIYSRNQPSAQIPGPNDTPKSLDLKTLIPPAKTLTRDRQPNAHPRPNTSVRTPHHDPGTRRDTNTSQRPSPRTAPPSQQERFTTRHGPHHPPLPRPPHRPSRTPRENSMSPPRRTFGHSRPLTPMAQHRWHPQGGRADLNAPVATPSARVTSETAQPSRPTRSSAAQGLQRTTLRPRSAPPSRPLLRPPETACLQGSQAQSAVEHVPLGAEGTGVGRCHRGRH